MFFAFFLVLYVVNTEGVKEGDYCSKDGVVGVCVNIRVCSSALEEIKHRKQPQLCEFDAFDPIVCCIPSNTQKPPAGDCILPAYPQDGTYISNVPNGKPGEGYSELSVNVTCIRGYGVDGPRTLYCKNGEWQGQMPKCVSVCHLPPHSSVEYNCVTSQGGVNGFRACNEQEPHGTFVSPRCRSHYHSAKTLTYMHCIHGTWDYVAKCQPECGTVAPEGTELIVAGQPIRHGKVPWHAAIYLKTREPYSLVCGGSLISPSVVLSAAHCFWSYVDGKQPESNYAVAVGKIFRAWNTTDEEHCQHSDVKEIHIPSAYRGFEANFQDDIAVVVVRAEFDLKTHVRPVCLDFDYTFEKKQLRSGNLGKVAGWGLSTESADDAQPLKVLDMPHVTIATIINEWPESFNELITSDKIYAGQKVTDGLLLLQKGDSGGGIAFPDSDKDSPRYYLRGVITMVLASCAADKEGCNSQTYIGFTHVSQHAGLINRFWGK